MTDLGRVCAPAPAPHGTALKGQPSPRLPDSPWWWLRPLSGLSPSSGSPPPHRKFSSSLPGPSRWWDRTASQGCSPGSCLGQPRKGFSYVASATGDGAWWMGTMLGLLVCLLLGSHRRAQAPATLWLCLPPAQEAGVLCIQCVVGREVTCASSPVGSLCPFCSVSP